jgi:hypothetical protein
MKAINDFFVALFALLFCALFVIVCAYIGIWMR